MSKQRSRPGGLSKPNINAPRTGAYGGNLKDPKEEHELSPTARLALGMKKQRETQVGVQMVNAFSFLMIAFSFSLGVFTVLLQLYGLEALCWGVSAPVVILAVLLLVGSRN